jgi:hypothetical protein
MSLFVFLMIFVCISMFISIFNNSFQYFRKHVNENHEIILFIWRKLQIWIGNTIVFCFIDLFI